jgi:hypothetical protein
MPGVLSILCSADRGSLHAAQVLHSSDLIAEGNIRAFPQPPAAKEQEEKPHEKVAANGAFTPSLCLRR